MSQHDPLAQKTYWEKAGREGYTRFMYGSQDVEAHVTQRMWSTAISVSQAIGLDSNDCVLDLGCGDGAFANRILANHFRKIDGFDFSEGGIKRATAEAPRANIRFQVLDLTRADLRLFPKYDGAFLVGILHHVKGAAAGIVKSLREIVPRVVVVEPNGNNLARKALELTPSYRAAGEASWRHSEIIKMFEQVGYRSHVCRHINIFPNFTPGPVFRMLRSVESVIESTPGLRALCTINIYGFVAQGEIDRTILNM